MVLHGVQYLRGIAVVLVVLMHSNGMIGYPKYFEQSPLPLVHTGLFGVVIFFVISGFIITIVTLEPETLRPRIGVQDFALRRFVRIVPYMWVCIVFYNVLSYLGVGKVELGDALRAMTLWPLGELKPNVIWSLRHELFFYALFAAAFLLGRSRPWVLIAWLVAPIVASAALSAAPSAAAAAPPVVIELVRVFLIGADSGANLQFAAGFALGVLWLRRSKLMAVRLPIGPIGLLALALACAAVVEITALENGLARYLVWTAMATAIVWLGITAAPGSGRVHELAILLGNASFSIYLIHNPVLLTFMEASVKVGAPFGVWAMWLILAASAIAVCVIAWKLIEKPLIEAITARLQAPAPRPKKLEGL